MKRSTHRRHPVDKRRIPVDTNKIRSLRESLKLSQAEAARRAGLGSRQKWHDLENGHRPIATIELLERIATALGVKARDLLK